MSAVTDGAQIILAYLPDDMAGEWVEVGLAEATASSDYRGVGDVVAVLVVGAMDVATVVTLLQGPSTWSELVRWLRRRRVGQEGLTVEIRTQSGVLSLSLDDGEDERKVVDVVRAFLDEEQPG